MAKLSATKTRDLSQEVLKELFDYVDGELVYRESNNRAVKGTIVGSIDPSHGYRRVTIDYTKHYIHRLVWIYFNGPIASGLSIDHINHKKSDNRIDNLRTVTHKENHKNQKVRINNTSGVNGVLFDKSRDKWQSRIMVDGKMIHLGRFEKLKDAIESRLNANLKYKFHPNHGVIQ